MSQPFKLLITTLSYAPGSGHSTCAPASTGVHVAVAEYELRVQADTAFDTFNRNVQEACAVERELNVPRYRQTMVKLY